MASRWYYTHEGQTHGPITGEEIRSRAVTGLLQPEDLVWPEEKDLRQGVVASAALDFAALRSGSASAPDWLSDVAKAEQEAIEGPRPPKGPLPERLDDIGRLRTPDLPSVPLPSWLSDVQRQSQLDLAQWIGAKKRQAPPPSLPQVPLPASGRRGQDLSEELSAAVEYVRSLLPPPATEPVRLDWRYVPTTHLGGDGFGYLWLDVDHLAFYLLDVTGHGLGAALLSVTVMNVLRSLALPNTDFRKPGQVLGALNEAFKMQHHAEKCFTIWYGVHRRSQRRLTWAGAGHPAALLFAPSSLANGGPIPLESQGPMIGAMEWPQFQTDERRIEPGTSLYVYSDGVREIQQPDGSMWHYDEFVRFLRQTFALGQSLMDRLLEHVRKLRGSDTLEDDFSILEVKF